MEEHRKRVYETTFIVNATLDDAQIDQVIERFREFIAKNEAEIRTLDKWGRKRLAYPIQKKNNGYYVVCEFSAAPDIVARLERYYHLDENIMRFLTVQLSEKMLKARQEQERRAATPSEPPAPSQADARPERTVIPPGARDDDEEGNDDAT